MQEYFTFKLSDSAWYNLQDSLSVRQMLCLVSVQQNAFLKLLVFTSSSGDKKHTFCMKYHVGRAVRNVALA
jgi:hypothetical protein